MELRGLTGSDIEQALVAHEELAAEQFEFLLGYGGDQAWTQFLEDVESTR